MSPQVYLEVQGQFAPNLEFVWIPGWGGTAFGLLPLIRQLQFGYHRILEPVGLHAELDDDETVSMSRLADILMPRIADLRSPFLCGVSMGGLLAPILASRTACSGVHLFCTSIGGRSQKDPIEFEARAEWFRRLRPNEDPLMKSLRPCFSPAEIEAGLLQDYYVHLSQQPIALSGHVLKLYWQAMLQWDSTPVLQSLGLPVWLHRGLEDRVVGEKQHQRLKEAKPPSAEFTYDGGHLFFLSQPAKIKSHLLECAHATNRTTS